MTERVGEILPGKIGGVTCRCKKSPSEREPLLLLHLLQAATRLSIFTGSPPCLMLMT
jgi:hypothetical protein